MEANKEFILIVVEHLSKFEIDQALIKKFGYENISSEEFVKTVREAHNSAPKGSAADKKISAQEVEDWLKVFNDKKH